MRGGGALDTRSPHADAVALGVWTGLSGLVRGPGPQQLEAGGLSSDAPVTAPCV